MLTRVKLIVLLGIGALCAPAFGAIPARPGTVNYIEGAASLDGKQLNSHDVGTVTLNAGDELTTQQGRAEVLLTPGVFLRLGDDSAVKMISPDLTLTQVELEHGHAGVEVDQIFKQNDLQVIDAGVATQLVQNGYYEFDTNPATVKVFNGKAAVEVKDGKYKVLKSDHEFALDEGTDGKPLAKEKPEKFNAKANEDPPLQLEQPTVAVPGRGQRPDCTGICWRRVFRARLVLGSVRLGLHLHRNGPVL